MDMVKSGSGAPGWPAERSQSGNDYPPGVPPPSLLDPSVDFVSQALPYWCAWPNLRSPRYIVRTNRDVVPEVPPENPREPECCVDGRFGLLEASRLPQLHEDDKWHRAFIPMVKPRDSEVPFEIGRPWWHIEHSDASADLAWYRLADEHIQPVSNELVRPFWQLRNRIEVTEIEMSLSWRSYLRKAHEWLPSFTAPHDRYAQFVELSRALCRQPLARWDLRVHFANWQRCLNEVRGWVTFVDATINTPWAAGRPDLLAAAAAQQARRHVATRQVAPYRGVFVRDEATALLCAAYDVPVWLLVPFEPGFLSELYLKQQSGTLRRAMYRKYGTAYCSYIHGIERSYHESPLPVADVYRLSHSTKAYSCSHWIAEDVNPLDHQAAHARGESSVGASSTTSANWPLPAKPVAVPPRDPPATSARQPANGNTATLSSLPSAAPGKGGKKRKAGGLADGEHGQEKAKKQKRSVIGQLLDEHGSSLKATDVELSRPGVADFNTQERPHWFPRPFFAAQNVQCRVDIGRNRQIALVASSESPIPTHVASKGRLYKIPLLSYFLNAWADGRKKDFNKPKGKGGIPRADVDVAYKLPGHNVTQALYIWLKIRPYYLLKLSSSDASESPGFPAPVWRKIFKIVLDTKQTASVIVLLGLDASLPQAEPRRLTAPEPEQDDPDEDLTETSGMVSTQGVSDSSTHSACTIQSHSPWLSIYASPPGSPPLRDTSALLPCRGTGQNQVSLAPAPVSDPFRIPAHGISNSLVPVPAPSTSHSSSRPNAQLPPRPAADLPSHSPSPPGPPLSHPPGHSTTLLTANPSDPEPAVPTADLDNIGTYLDRIAHPTFDGHELPPWVRTEDAIWPTLPWRQYILWEMGELGFRFELFFLDLTIRQAHPEHVPVGASTGDRYRQCKECWGGSDFVPGTDPRSHNQLCDLDERRRLVALHAFYEFMRSWPRATDFLGPWLSLDENGTEWDKVDAHSNLFYDLESSIWHCYGQIFFDYCHRLPLIPNVRPDMPVS